MHRPEMNAKSLNRARGLGGCSRQMEEEKGVGTEQEGGGGRGGREGRHPPSTNPAKLSKTSKYESAIRCTTRVTGIPSRVETIWRQSGHLDSLTNQGTIQSVWKICKQGERVEYNSPMTSWQMLQTESLDNGLWERRRLVDLSSIEENWPDTAK